jgi:hypothetical protein
VVFGASRGDQPTKFGWTLAGDSAHHSRNLHPRDVIAGQLLISPVLSEIGFSGSFSRSICSAISMMARCSDHMVSQAQSRAMSRHIGRQRGNILASGHRAGWGSLIGVIKRHLHLFQELFSFGGIGAGLQFGRQPFTLAHQAHEFWAWHGADFSMV